MPLPVIAVALVAVEITAEDALLIAGGTVLLIGLQSQLNTYLNRNHIKRYRSVSPQEISSRSYNQLFVFPNVGQQLLLFSTQLEIEWVKREYLQWQSQIQSSYCNIQDEVKRFLILMQNKNKPSSDQIKYRSYSERSIFAEHVSKSGGSPNPNKNNKNKKEEDKDIKDKDIKDKDIKERKPTKGEPQETEGSILARYYEQARRWGTGGNFGHLGRP